MDDQTNNLHRNEVREENYYTVLGCSENATFKELKQSYQDLIKKCHPDKVAGSPVSNNKFVMIDKAYKTLRDTQLRKEYDASLLEDNFNDKPLIYAELAKDELQFNEENLAFYSCRCGDEFTIQKDFLNEEECIIECAECTNCILIR